MDNKYSYPNNDFYQYIPGQRDMSKWTQAVKTIYNLEKQGLDRSQAIKQATKYWNDDVEVYDFLNWMKFYEEGAHLKYKTAQLWYENNGMPGYFLNIKKSPQEDEVQKVNDQETLNNANLEKKQIIERQRAKIISRLDSAEKLLRTQEGHLFAGQELEDLMETIYNLKKKIQLVNKLSTSIRLYEDMIIREANTLNKKGYYSSSDFLYKIADNMPLPASPAPPTQGSGAAGGLPSVGPGMPQNPPDSAPNENPAIPEKKEQPKAIKEFNRRMENADVSDEELSVDDNNLEDLEVKAQAIPIDEPITTDPSPAPKNPTAPFTPTDKIKKPIPANPANELIVDEGKPAEEPLEVSEEDLKHTEENLSDPNKVDQKINEVFSDITIDDIIAKLEDLAKIFKVREIPRQLSIVDMMLDSLNMSSFFVELSEAINKSLESNNYISTRIDGILARLRGASKTNNIDLKGNSDTNNPKVEQVKNKLIQDEEKEKERKQLRKEQETANLTKEQPKVEMTEDLQPKPAAPIA